MGQYIRMFAAWRDAARIGFVLAGGLFFLGVIALAGLIVYLSNQ